jgi:hypothetical protein
LLCLRLAATRRDSVAMAMLVRREHGGDVREATDPSSGRIMDEH